ncbi:MAG: 1-deoxy-D-xylulose-5-phosphate reductoisomerase [Cryomorphaceae bacterium]|jgi:1-deoxy-D-xylulose-5-phosphate reductoisomerase
MQGISILGSTGSVGQSTLDVLALHPERFAVVAITANTNVSKMIEQCQQYRPQTVVMSQAVAAREVEQRLDSLGLSEIEVLSGAQSVCDIATDGQSQLVMSAIVGAAGLLPTLAAVKAGKKVLIANKEPLVMTGDLFMREAHSSGAVILPIDSEHNAIFQCLPHDQSKQGVKRIHLTASGGPFRGRSWSELESITPAEACAHPNWSMGRKISVDSATMMNKGLELIEAAALFSLPSDQVEIVVHPQSIIHSMVEYLDGSFLAQLGSPDMKIPITHALSWPERILSGAKTLDITEIAQLDFHKPDMPNLPCLRLARYAAEQGGSAPAVLNAANEIAVQAFLEQKIRFTQIPDIIDAVLSDFDVTDFDTIESVLTIDNEARELAKAALDSRLVT